MTTARRDFKTCIASTEAQELDFDRTLRVVLISDASSESRSLLRELELADCAVVQRLQGQLKHADLTASLAQLRVDLIVVDIESAESGLLEPIVGLAEAYPVVVFACESDSASIRAAVGAGVAAYVVRSVHTTGIRPVLTVAMARFQTLRMLKSELEKARSSLADRKVVERAKGIVMARRHMSEEEAYRWLRTAAMNRGMRLVDVAHKVIDMAGLL